MTFFKRLLCASLLLICVLSIQGTYAIGKKTATCGAIGGSVVLGAISGYETYMAIINKALVENFWLDCHDKFCVAELAVIVGLAVAGTSCLVLNKLLLKLTPKYRIKKALKIINEIEMDSLLLHVNLFGGSWPLISARDYLLRAFEKLEKAKKMVISIKDNSYCVDAALVLDKIQELTNRLANQMDIISHDYNYQRQLDLYTEHKEAEYQRYQERIEKEKDRELERQMFAQKVIEK